MLINGYEIDENNKIITGGAVCWKAYKNGSTYFLKCFNDPKRPSLRVSETVRKQRNQACDTFLRERRKILNAIRPLDGSNIIAPVEFFEYNRMFYQSTAWRDIKTIGLDEISGMSEDVKIRLFKTATQNLKIIHKQKIIHLDIKPSNMLVTRNATTGKTVCALIDFDSSYFVGCLPPPELTASTDPYMSPEFAAYKMNSPKYGGMAAITEKNDVFALAIVFHEYWSGRKFIFKGSDGVQARYLYQAVDANEKIQTDTSVPEWLKCLLLWMIQKSPANRPTMAEVLIALSDHSTIKGFDSTQPADEPVVKSEYDVRVEPKREPEPVPKREPEPLRRKEPEDVYTDTPWEKNIYKKIDIYEKNLIFDDENNSFGSQPEPKPKVVPEPEPEPVKTPKTVVDGYVKGAGFPDDAVKFDVLSNGNIKIYYKDGSTISYKVEIAIKRGYVSKA